MRSRVIAGVILVAFMTVGCHPPVNIVTPEGKKIYTANEVLKRVEELQNAAIKADTQKVIPTHTARIIVQFTVSSARTIGMVSDGWGIVVAKAWAEVKAQIPLEILNNPAIKVAVFAVDIALATFLAKGDS
jgi:hypothetical protein